MAEHFDVIVVGAGASGGVLAARLSEDPAVRVLLLDAGPDFPSEADLWPQFVVSGEHSWRVSGIPEMDWGFYDRDRAGRRGGRPVRLPRGKLVGGSSMVNATIAVRPAPFDLDRWAALGCPGWDWRDAPPLFHPHRERSRFRRERDPRRGWADRSSSATRNPPGRRSTGSSSRRATCSACRPRRT